MRMAYLDEAGISNPKHEPFVVVAGVLVNADTQWQAVESYLADLADEYAPPEHRQNFHFHATELFSGGKIFPRDKYDKEHRWKILDEILKIPKKFKLPIAPGWVNRAKLSAKYLDEDSRQLTLRAQTVAFAVASYAVDFYMQNGKDVANGEVASLVVENNYEVREQLKNFHKFNRNPRNAEMLRTQGYGMMAYKRIIGTPHFEEKGDSSALQIADACAFAIKRHLMKTPESARFYGAIQSGMILLDKSELDENGVPIKASVLG